jgi:alpha-glucan, water dikinase
MGSEYFIEIKPNVPFVHQEINNKYNFQVNIFTEEIIRGGSAATLSALLNRFDPVLRNVAHLGR